MYQSVSIVIPCYNVEAYVSEAIESALAQTYPIHKIVCVDDGSCDSTLTILREYEARYPSKISVVTGPNKGGNHARNLGLNAISSDYVQFLDADDVLFPDKIEVQIGLIAEASVEPTIVVGAFRNSADPASGPIFTPQRLSPLVNLARSALGRTSGNLWKVDALREVSGWNEEWKSSQEAELMLRLLKAGGEVLYDDHVGTWRRKRDGSVSSTSDPQRFVCMVEHRADILQYAKAIGSPKADQGEIERSLFQSVRLLGLRDLERAVGMHETHVPRSFAPDRRHAGCMYAICYRVLGFERSERLRSAAAHAWKALRRG